MSRLRLWWSLGLTAAILVMGVVFLIDAVPTAIKIVVAATVLGLVVADTGLLVARAIRRAASSRSRPS